MPVIGDSVIPARANPSASAAAVTSSTTRAVHGGVARRCPLADFVAPGFELRLDQDDDVRVRRSSGGTPAECGAAR